MIENWFSGITLMAYVFLYIPLLIFVLRFKNLSKIQLVIGILVVNVVITESASRIMWYHKINNLPLYHLYVVIEFLLICLIYRKKLKTLFSHLFFGILATAFIITAIINVFFFQDIYTFNSNMTTIEGLIVVFFCLSFFYKLLKEVKYTSLETNPMFWINSGFLIYFSSNLILFFINNKLFQGSTEASYMVWGLHAIVNIIQTIFYTIALCVHQKRP